MEHAGVLEHDEALFGGGAADLERKEASARDGMAARFICTEVERKAAVTVAFVLIAAPIAAAKTLSQRHRHLKPTHRLRQDWWRIASRPEVRLTSGGRRWQATSGGRRWQVTSGGKRWQVTSGGRRWQVTSGGRRLQVVVCNVLSKSVAISVPSHVGAVTRIEHFK